MSRRDPRVVAALLALVTIALLLFVTAATAAATPELNLAPLNPAFVQYQQDLAAGRLAHSAAGGHGIGLRPAPLDLSYLDHLAVPGAATSYPATYDLRTLGRVTPAKDQGPNGTCWIFATMGSLESCLLPGATYDFSEDNCATQCGFDKPKGTVRDRRQLPEEHGLPGALGRADARESGRLRRQRHPCRPHADQARATGPVAAGRRCSRLAAGPPAVTSIAKDAIKAAVTQHGGVWTSIHVGDADQTTYFNDATDAWYYPGTASADHAVLIVGWDDDYAAHQLRHRPPPPATAPSS